MKDPCTDSSAPLPGGRALDTLAWATVDVALTADRMQDELRPRIQANLGAAVRDEDWPRAAAAMQDLVDSWPLAAGLDAARNAWAEEADPDALAVLYRAAEVARVALGWPAGTRGDWLAAPQVWLDEQDIQDKGTDVPASPPCVLVAAADVVQRRNELAAALAAGTWAAVDVQGALPDSPAAQLAMAEFRLEGRGQVGLELYGVAGLWVDRPPRFSDLLATAEAGRPGPLLSSCCDCLLLPGTPGRLAQGRTDTVGWLVWPALVRPVAVAPVAVALLQALDGRAAIPEVANTVGLPVERASEILAELVGIGAASAAG